MKEEHGKCPLSREASAESKCPQALDVSEKRT